MLKDAIGLVQNAVLEYGLKVILFIILLIVGLKIISMICKSVQKIMEKKGVEITIVKFTNSLLKISLKILLVLALLQSLGAQVTSFVAILGAASFAVGMALQGSLSNFAAGVILLILKPFKVGDFVEISGKSGTVSSIQVFSTILKTPDNKTIILPNGGIIGTNIINYSVEERRRVDFVFGVDYNSDLKKAKAVMYDVVSSNPLVLKEPDIFVGVEALADSSVNFKIKAWVNAADYWTVYYEINEAMKLRLDAESINIPYPHIHVVNG